MIDKIKEILERFNSLDVEPTSLDLKIAFIKFLQSDIERLRLTLRDLNKEEAEKGEHSTELFNEISGWNGAVLSEINLKCQAIEELKK